MTTPATIQKRRELAHFIATALAPEPAVQGVIGEAFIRSHEEPGRAWNMDEWNAQHRSRKVADDDDR